MSLELRVLPITELVPAPYNPRRALRPTDAAWRKLETSLREFGLVEPLVWNETTGHVVGGHARLAILKSQGVTEVTVSVVRLEPSREKALNVVLNNREAQGRFDPSRLAALLAELESLPELALTGFTPADLKDLCLEPLDALEPEPAASRVDVTLEFDEATYDRASAALDELVSRFDLVCHVRRRSGL
jgi:ParB-like chromosome segregation protein Spo0J